MHPFGLTSFGPGPPRARGQPTAVDRLLRSGGERRSGFRDWLAPRPRDADLCVQLAVRGAARDVTLAALV